MFIYISCAGRSLTAPRAARWVRTPFGLSYNAFDSERYMLTYANRVGITIAEHASGSSSETEVEKYLKKSSLLQDKPQLLRLDVMQEDADEPRLIEGIKHLISE